MDLTDQDKNDKGGGLITMGYLPSREQISLFSMEGKMDPRVLDSAMDVLTETNLKVYAVVKKQAAELLENQLNNGDCK